MKWQLADRFKRAGKASRQKAIKKRDCLVGSFGQQPPSLTMPKRERSGRTTNARWSLTTPQRVEGP